MADELENIFDFKNGDISKETFMKYLKGELTPEEQHEVEKAMVDSEMLSDAMEGLQSMGNSNRIPQIQNQIDNRLKDYLLKRKNKRERRKIKDMNWMIVFVIIVLGLALIGLVIFFVEKRG